MSAARLSTPPTQKDFWHPCSCYSFTAFKSKFKIRWGHFMDTSTANGHIAELHNQKLVQSPFWCQRNRDLLPHTVGFFKFWPTLKAPGVWRQQNISKSLYGSQTSLCYINSFTLHRDLAGRKNGRGKKKWGWEKKFFFSSIRDQG